MVKGEYNLRPLKNRSDTLSDEEKKAVDALIAIKHIEVYKQSLKPLSLKVVAFRKIYNLRSAK